MTQAINIDQIKQQLYNRLKPSGWGHKLKGFLLSEDFDAIIEYLVDQVERGKRVTPPLKFLLRAFEECPYEDLKVVFVGGDPYPQLGVADGIGYSCSITGKEQGALRKLFNALQETRDNTYERDPNLKRWSNQGILLLNAALTCQIGTPGSHIEPWRPFTTYLLDTINYENSGLVFVLLGDQAARYAELIGNQHYVLQVDDPAIPSPAGNSWEHKDIFRQVNALVQTNYQRSITW